MSAYLASCLSGRPDAKLNLLVPLGVGSGVAFSGGGTSWSVILLALPALIAVQAGTTLVRQTKSELRIPGARHIGTLLYVFALMLAWMVHKQRGWPVVALALWLSLAYSSMPGWAGRMPVYQATEQGVILLLGLMSTMAVSLLHQGSSAWDAAVLLAGFQVGCIAVAQTAACNACDPGGDGLSPNLMSSSSTNPGAGIQVAVFVGLAYAAGLMWLANGFWLAALLPIFSLPFSGLLLVRVLAPGLQRPGTPLLRLSSALALSFSLTLGLGLAGHSRQTQLALLLR